MNKRLMASLAISSVAATSFFVNVDVQNATAKEKAITLTMLSADGDSAHDSKMADPIGKMIKSKTGVTLKREYIVGDQSQKVGVMLASGKLPDMLFLKTLQQDNVMQAKKYVSLAPLLEKYGPNIKKLYGKYYKRLKVIDPKNKNIYILPSYGVASKNWWDGGELQIAADALAEQKYPKLTTLTKYENAIKAYIKKHPTINGQKTIGLTFNADDSKIWSSIINGATHTAGNPDDGNWIIDSKGNAKMAFISQAHHDFFKWLNHMNDIGLVDPEAFIQKTDQYDAKMASGRVVATIAPSWMFDNASKSLRGKDNGKMMVIPVPAMQKEGIKDQFHRPNGFNPGYGVGITTSCKNPQRAIKFINYLCSEEGQILTHWGIKGVNYEVVNGKRKLTAKELKDSTTDPFHGKKTGIGSYSYPFPEYGDGTKDSNGDYYTRNNPETISSSYSKAEKDAAKAYGVPNFMSCFTPEEKIPESPWGAAWQISIPSTSNLNVKSKQFEDMTKSKLPELVVCKASDFESKWKEYVKSFKDAGAEQYEKDFSKLVKNRVKQLGN